MIYHLSQLGNLLQRDNALSPAARVTNEDTPRPELLGLFERITIYAYQLWIFILAYLLIKEQPEQVESGE